MKQVPGQFCIVGNDLMIFTDVREYKCKMQHKTHGENSVSVCASLGFACVNANVSAVVSKQRSILFLHNCKQCVKQHEVMCVCFYACLLPRMHLPFASAAPASLALISPCLSFKRMIRTLGNWDM